MAEHLTAFYEFGPFRLDIRGRTLLRDGEQVPLTPRTFETLLVLVRNRDRVVEKQELLDTLWPDSEVEENNLNQSISAVRKALGEKPGEQKYIKTVPRRGYRFVAVVREARPDSTGLSAGERDSSPAGASEYQAQATTARRGAEPRPMWGSTRADGGLGGTHQRPLAKLVVALAATLACCVAAGVVVLRAVRRAEERTGPLTEKVEKTEPRRGKVEVEVWWPKEGVRVSGRHPFKAIATNLSLAEYTMYWQVDGDRLNPLANNYEEYPHKEVLVDLSGWNWRGGGPYKVNFVAKDVNGVTIAERAVNIYVSP